MIIFFIHFFLRTFRLTFNFIDAIILTVMRKWKEELISHYYLYNVGIMHENIPWTTIRGWLRRIFKSWTCQKNNELLTGFWVLNFNGFWNFKWTELEWRTRLLNGFWTQNLKLNLTVKLISYLTLKCCSKRCLLLRSIF